MPGGRRGPLFVSPLIDLLICQWEQHGPADEAHKHMTRHEQWRGDSGENPWPFA